MNLKSPNISILLDKNSEIKGTSVVELVEEFLDKFEHEVFDMKLMMNMEYFMEEVESKYNIDLPIHRLYLQEGKILITDNDIIKQIVERRRIKNENSNR